MIVNIESTIVEQGNPDFYMNFLFSKLEEKEVHKVFSLICDVEGLTGTYRRTTIHFFNTIYSTLHYLYETKEIDFLNMNILKDCLNLDTFIAFSRRRDFSPSIMNSLKKVFSYLENYEDSAKKQDQSVHEEFNIYSTAILFLIDKIAIGKLYALEDMQLILGKLNTAIEKSEEEALISNFFKHSIKENHLKLHEEKEVVQFLRSKLDTENNVICSSNLIQSFHSEDKESIFEAIDDYVSYYTSMNNIEEDNLTIHNKLQIFSSKFCLADYDSLHKESLLQLILSYNNNDLFIEILKHYNIPFNIPVEITMNENDIEPVVKDLLSYCLHHNVTLLEDILKIDNTIINTVNYNFNSNDKIYTYSFDPMEKLSYEELIKLAYYSQDIREKIDLKRMLIKQDYHNFVTLYNIRKSLEDNFVLENSKSILKVYINTIDKLDLLHNDILKIFIEENCQLGSEDFSIFSSLAENLKEKYEDVDVDNYLISITKQLLPLFSNDLKSLLLKEEPVIDIEPYSQLEEHNVHWYNPDVILKGLKNAKGSKNKVLNQLLLSNSFKKPILRIEDESFFDELEYDMPHFKEVLDYYKGQFRQNYYSNKYHITPIILLGDPGIGKTYFAKQLAKKLDTGYSFVDMASITSSWILSGNNGTWQDSKQGKIFEAVLNSKTINPIMLMDEIDKVSSGKYDPLGPLYQLLEEVNAVEFTDEFLDISFNAAGVIYIACANTINTLSEPLLSRFKVFNVPSPTDEQLDKIILSIYHIALNDNPLMSKELSTDIIRYLKSNSLRESKVMIEEAISNVMLSYSRAELNQLKLDNKQLILSLENFKDKKLKGKLGFSRQQ